MPRFDKLEFESERDRSPSVAPIAEDQDISSLQRADKNRRAGHYENALRLYSRALEDDKNLVAGWVGQVQMLVILGECKEAELWARKALELFPGNGDLQAGRGQALCRLGDLQQAHVLCDGALQQAGSSAYRWLVRGEVLLAGRQSVDRHCFDKAEQLDRDWLVPLEAALIYLHYGSAAPAHLRARRAVELAPDQPYAWLIQARCQIRLHHIRAARESLQRTLELSPGYVEAQRMQTELESSGSLLQRLFRGIFG